MSNLETMNIHAKPGHKVVFAGVNGSTSDLYHGGVHLKVGEVYTVDDINIGNWSTYVYLKEIPEQAFNSVLFKDYQPLSRGNNARKTGGSMERNYSTGQAVIYVDAYGVKHDALITKWWNGDQTIEMYLSQYGDPGCNLVYVVKDESKTDSYGRQILRETSVIHKSRQAAPGNYYCWPDEV